MVVIFQRCKAHAAKFKATSDSRGQSPHMPCRSLRGSSISSPEFPKESSDEEEEEEQKPAAKAAPKAEAKPAAKAAAGQSAKDGDEDEDLLDSRGSQKGEVPPGVLKGVPPSGSRFLPKSLNLGRSTAHRHVH